MFILIYHVTLFKQPFIQDDKLIHFKVVFLKFLWHLKILFLHLKFK